ncbi:hypothetical protein ACFSTC_11825 [Nonomuraea ferruginea]
MTGTTTTPGRVGELREVCSDVAVLRGSDRAAVQRVVEEADAVVLTVSPRLTRSFDAAQRVAEYADTLTASARTAVEAHPRVVFTSSVSVYGSRHGSRGGRGHARDRRPRRLPAQLRRRRGRRARHGRRGGRPHPRRVRASA